jgi:hypothetical protein
VRKHVRAPPHRNVVPTESHSDDQRASYFPRTLRTLLLAALRELLPLVCACDHLQEAYNQSDLLHPPRDQGFHTEVDVRGRHERGSMRSFGAAVT